MTHLAWRVVGVALTALALLAYGTDVPEPVRLLLLPLAMAFAAWLIVRNAAAVLLAVTALATIHSDVTDPSWIVARAYPAVAVLAGTSLVGVTVRRFRCHVLSTRAARWQNRHPQRPDV